MPDYDVGPSRALSNDYVNGDSSAAFVDGVVDVPLDRLSKVRAASRTAKIWSTKALAEQIKLTAPSDIFVQKILFFNHQSKRDFTPHFKGEVVSRGIIFAVVRLYSHPGSEEHLERWRDDLETQSGIPIVLEGARISSGVTRQLLKVADEDGKVRSSEAVEKLINKMRGPAPYEPISSRAAARALRGVVDLTRHSFVAIDPPGTPDPEDLLFATRLRNGNTRLFISFVDVAWRVPPGSLTAEYAEQVGFSLYSRHRVLPMLGPKLAFDELAFTPGQPRRAFTVMLEVSRSGEIKRSSFFQSVVKNSCSLTYEQVEAIQRGQAHELSDVISTLSEATHRLRKRREGKVNFVELAQGQENRQVVHEAMIAGRQTIANVFHKAGMSALFRYREPPKPETVTRLVRSIQATGVPALDDDFKNPRRFGALLMCLKEAGETVLIREILDVYQGRTRISTDPRPHSELGGKPYLDFKGRDFDGLVNQWLASQLLNHQPLITHAELKRHERRLNRKESTLGAELSQFFTLEFISHRLRGVDHVVQATVVTQNTNGFEISTDSPRMSGTVRVIDETQRRIIRDGQRVIVALDGYDLKKREFTFRWPRAGR